ncbi:hypothetical protein T08_4708 [Trichinella sp. T8]|nr:hypothetical protein T08_4708 [Trichinella sp. T8]
MTEDIHLQKQLKMSWEIIVILNFLHTTMFHREFQI